MTGGDTLRVAKGRAEDVLAMFGPIKAVGSAVEDCIRYYIKGAPLDEAARGYLGYHADQLQELLGVILYLLGEMETEQDTLVSFLAEWDADAPSHSIGKAV